MNIPKLSELNDSSCREKSIKLHFPEFYEYIINNYSCVKWTEKLFWFYNNIESTPKCPVCGNDLKFLSLSRGYTEFCSNKCIGKSKDIINRKKQTSLIRFGVENPLSLKKVQEKQKATNREKYGVDNVFQSEKIKDKIRETHLKKRGVTHHLKSTDSKEKLKNTMRSKNIDNINDLIGYTIDGQQIRHCPHPNCNKCNDKYYIIDSSMYYGRIKYGSECCTKLLKPGAKHDSSLEQSIDEILTLNNIKFIRNSRSILNPKELDFYIPEYSLAIECNGIWAHSTINNLEPKSEDYHINKTINCSNNGIKLLHLWEDWFIYKKEIIISTILANLNIYNNNIFGKSCEIKYIDDDISYEFQNNNSLYEICKSDYNIGLYYKDILVYLININNIDKNIYEIAKITNLLDTNIVDGFEIITDYIINKFNPHKLYMISQNDTDYCDDDIKYIFKKDHVINTYKYFNKKDFTIIKNPSVTDESHYFKIYDSGQTKWVWEKSSDNI